MEKHVEVYVCNKRFAQMIRVMKGFQKRQELSSSDMYLRSYAIFVSYIRIKVLIEQLPRVFSYNKPYLCE